MQCSTVNSTLLRTVRYVTLYSTLNSLPIHLSCPILPCPVLPSLPHPSKLIQFQIETLSRLSLKKFQKFKKKLFEFFSNWPTDRTIQPPDPTRPLSRFFRNKKSYYKSEYFRPLISCNLVLFFINFEIRKIISTDLIIFTDLVYFFSCIFFSSIILSSPLHSF